MWLSGSCRCGIVQFQVWSRHFYPYSLCYCSICRKTAGGGGYAINLAGDSSTLRVRGMKSVRIYRAEINREKSSGRRHFCVHCGSYLWLYDPNWPELVHPFASAIDTELPVPPERTHGMVGSKAPWVEIQKGPRDKVFEEYPDESIAEWHQRLNLEDSSEMTPPPHLPRSELVYREWRPPDKTL